MYALNFEVNSFVSKMAKASSDDVELDFLVSYLDGIKNLNHPSLKVHPTILDPLLDLTNRKAEEVLSGTTQYKNMVGD